MEQLDQAVAAAAEGAGLAGILLMMPEGPEAPYLPVCALQALLKSAWRAPPRLWVVTWGAQAADPRGGERLSIDHSAAWGGCRVIAEEHPDFWGGLIDLDPKAPATADAALVVNMSLSPMVRIRSRSAATGGSSSRLAPISLDASGDTFSRAPDAAYLITRRLWIHRAAFG